MENLTSSQSAVGKVSGMPLTLLRVEGLAFFVAALATYYLQGGDWPLFVALFLVPDVAMIGYLAGPKIGAVAYNLAHTTTTYFAVLGVGVLLHKPTTELVALIGLAHIGFDRAMGYGLKYPDGFKEAHLGSLGPKVS